MTMTNNPQAGQATDKERLAQSLEEVGKEIKSLKEDPARRLSREFDLKQMQTLQERLERALGGQE